MSVLTTQRHALRDLDPRGRLVAAFFAVALCLAPLAAFVWATPDWAPASDPALMGVRSLDVGTSRTPVSGQPSTSGLQAEEEILVTHPGPIHFYALAVPIRVLGADVGMVLVSVTIVAACVLLAAWAVYRQLGPAGGIVAVVVLGAVMFTTGAASLVNPVSSNIARYPLLCTMVLLWCLLCGDNRLLPLAVAVFTVAAQQHLSVLPSLAVVAVLTAVAVAWQQRHRWRHVAIWPIHRTPLGQAAVVGTVLGSPVVVQELFGDRGNLSAMLEFGGSNSRGSVGFGSALDQIARALGWPPLLGQLHLDGAWLLTSPSAPGRLVAATTLGLVAVLTWRGRQTAPPRARMGLMVLILLVAGLVSGSQVPDSLERFRLALYHWAWPLTLFVALVVALGMLDLVQRTPLGGMRLVRPALVVAAALAAVLPAVVNPSLDRPSNTLAEAYSPVRARHYDTLADQIMRHADALGEQTLVAERSADPPGRLFRGLGSGLSLELIERGVDARFSPWHEQATHADRHISRENLDSTLVLVTDELATPFRDPVPGELVAEVDVSGIDHNALAGLVEQARSADETVFGAELDDYVAGLPEDARYLTSLGLGAVAENPRPVLLNQRFLGILRAHPPQAPALDPDLLDRLAESLEQRPDELKAVLRVYLLDREEALAYLTNFDLGFEDPPP